MIFYGTIVEQKGANMQTLPAVPDSDAWQRCYAAFLNQLYDRSRSSETVRQYSRMLARFFANGKHPSAITRADIDEFIHRPTAGQRSKGKLPSAATTNQRAAILLSWYKFCSEWTIAGPDGPERLLKTLPPTLGLKLGQTARTPHAMTEEELGRLFSVIDRETVKGARDYCILLFYSITARRRMELARLTYGDIKPAILVDGNGRRNGHVFTFQGKGHSQIEDTQECPLIVKQAIDHYLEMSGRLATIKPEDPLFVATDLNKGIRFDQTRALNDESIAHLFKFYCRKAGLSPKYSLHSLRHSSAQLRYAAGEDLMSISRVLRHASLQTTSIYMSSLSAPIDKGARALEVMFARF